MLLRSLFAWLLGRLARLAWRYLAACAQRRVDAAAGRLRRLLP